VRGKTVDDHAILNQLEELAENLGVKIRYEILKRDAGLQRGGLCRLKGEYLVFIDSKATTKERIDGLARTLGRFELDKVYIKPGLREFLGRYEDEAEPISEDE
jgi:hypothetical protein